MRFVSRMFCYKKILTWYLDFILIFKLIINFFNIML
jgi:hypothetical protein